MKRLRRENVNILHSDLNIIFNVGISIDSVTFNELYRHTLCIGERIFLFSICWFQVAIIQLRYFILFDWFFIKRKILKCAASPVVRFLGSNFFYCSETFKPIFFVCLNKYGEILFFRIYYD